ncbi:MAG: molybdopterin-dependent oxidoreductase [Campylobacterota bacterium]|nr:molybdopterin-dependent oxidoreductase [Campylobacterota bacterium]
MNRVTASPLDCYDACGIVYENSKIKALKDGHTQGFLCPHLNHYEKYEIITKLRYRGSEITLDEALVKLKEILNSYEKNEILHYRGSGNFALMQMVTDHFFTSFGATLTDGSLCDGAGEAGIIQGRGSNKNMPISEIAKSDVVIFWGRNPSVTSSHLLPLIKEKTLIVIDPIKTKIAKMADIYIQIKPHRDLLLGMLLSRFLYIQDGCDEEYLEKYASEYEDFYELTQSIRIKATLEDIGVTLGQIGEILEAVVDKKVAIVCGVGIQKYRDGADVMRAIDAFGVMLGLFGKEGCGVAYLGDSKEGIEMPFNTQAKRVSKVDTEFSNFKTVFIQGANPLSQMPNSLRVKESISKVKNIIYFGLYENESSEVADLVIPAKSFLYKNDVRTAYSHNAMMFMGRVADSKNGISEYDLSAYLCREFDIELKEEDFYIEYFKNFAVAKMDGSWHVKNRKEISYQDGFDTEDGEFIFLEDFDIELSSSKKLFLITPKSTISLNSQFKREESVYLHSALGFKDDEEVTISSACGSLKLRVRINNEIREDCVLIYSGTKGLNSLTTSKHSFDGKNAIYQENRVEVIGLT